MPFAILYRTQGSSGVMYNMTKCAGNMLTLLLSNRGDSMLYLRGAEGCFFTFILLTSRLWLLKK